MRQTTMGWTFHVIRKDGTVTWKPLKGLKESKPIKMADYVTAQGIQDEPAFTDGSCSHSGREIGLSWLSTLAFEIPLTSTALRYLRLLRMHRGFQEEWYHLLARQY